MREQIHHETVTPAEWLFCSDGLLPCFRDNETGIRNGPAFFQQARRAPLHGSPMQPACQTAGSPTGRPPRHPQRRSPRFTIIPDDRRRSPASQQPPATGGAIPRSTRQAADSPTARRKPASQQPPTTGGAAPASRPPRDRSRNGGQTGTAATRRAAVPCALLHKPAGPPPLCALSHNSPEPPRPAVPSHNPPGHRPSAPSRITPRNRRPPRRPLA